MLKKTTTLFIILFLLIIVGIYFDGAYYYKDKFQRNVYVNQINLSKMTLEQADRELSKADTWNQITIKSDSEEFLNIKAKEIDYKYIKSPNLPDILNKQNKWKWFQSIFKRSEYTTPMLSDYNKDNIKNAIDGIKELDKKLLNANIAYSNESNSFIIEPHSYEIKITKEELFDLVEKGIEKRIDEINIDNYIEQPTIFDNDKDLILAKDKANEYLNIELKYNFGDREEFIDSSLLKDWITISEKQVDLSTEKIKEYVIGLSIKYDTFNKNRNFKTSAGENIITNGGTYGWLIHRSNTVDELIQHIKNGQNKTIEPVYSYKALTRNSNDIGNSYVEIDLKNQMVYVYSKGKLIVKTPTVTGNISKGYNTPTGVFPLNYKEKDTVLNGSTYAAPVQYWMPFNGNIGLHDANWRSSFGGDIYKNNGSHGCINLPPKNTKAIFDSIYPGIPVIVH